MCSLREFTNDANCNSPSALMLASSVKPFFTEPQTNNLTRGRRAIFNDTFPRANNTQLRTASGGRNKEEIVNNGVKCRDSGSVNLADVEHDADTMMSTAAASSLDKPSPALLVLPGVINRRNLIDTEGWM